MDSVTIAEPLFRNLAKQPATLLQPRNFRIAEITEATELRTRDG
jgi:hypothetical protein